LALCIYVPENKAIDCFESILAGTYGVLRKNQNVLTELVDFLENTYYTIYLLVDQMGEVIREPHYFILIFGIVVN